jgi:hypothetical protein
MEDHAPLKYKLEEGSNTGKPNKNFLFYLTYQEYLLFKVEEGSKYGKHKGIFLFYLLIKSIYY